MPTPLLNAYAEQLPRLTAEESLLAAERVAVGSGTLKKGVGRRISEGWSRRAGRAAPAVKPKTPEAYRATLAGLGIGIKIEKRVTTERPDG